MDNTVDYFFSPVSPWSYLGHNRCNAIAQKHNAAIRLKPVDLGRIFPVSGGLPLAKRAPQRQAYRIMELKRWRAFLGVALTLQPKYFPVSPDLASHLIIAASEQSFASGNRLTEACMRGVWVEEKNISELETLRDIVSSVGLDADELFKNASELGPALYDRYTDEAMQLGVFGVPTYAYKGELFWGQDRLDFLDRALHRG
jgi:2-hydroxychromene-2-carboxylate isomerase